MPICETRICVPHHSLKLEKLVQEAHFPIVDLRRIWGHYKPGQLRLLGELIRELTIGMVTRLDHPQRICLYGVLVAGHLLLFVSPLW